MGTSVNSDDISADFCNFAQNKMRNKTAIKQNTSITKTISTTYLTDYQTVN